MSSRALALATMMGLIGCCAVGPAQAQENLEAGQNAAQIYAEACSACHKSTHGLLKTVRRGSLKGFLKEHYTTGPAMAALLADYLLSHGADDARFVTGPQQGPKQATRSESRPTNPIEQLFDSFGHRRNRAPQDATARASQLEQGSKADAKAGEREPASRHKRQARRADARDVAKPGAKEHATSAEPANARSREGRKLAGKHHADRHPKPDLGATPSGEVKEAPKPKEASGKTPANSAKAEAAQETPRETHAEASKSEAVKEERDTASAKANATKHENAAVDEGKKSGTEAVSETPSQPVHAEPSKHVEKEGKARPAGGGEPAATPVVSAAAPPPAPPATSSASPAGQPAPPASH